MSSKIVIFYRISFFFLFGSMPPKKHTKWKHQPRFDKGAPVEGGTLFLGCLRWRAKVHFLLRWEYLCSDGMRTSSLIEFGWISNRVPKNKRSARLHVLEGVAGVTCSRGGTTRYVTTGVYKTVILVVLTFNRRSGMLTQDRATSHASMFTKKNI